MRRILTAVLLTAALIAGAETAASAGDGELSLKPKPRKGGDVEIVKTSTTATNTAIGVAKCRDGFHATGGGFEGTRGQSIAPDFTRPTDDGRGWTASLSTRVPQPSKTLTITVFAICQED